MARPIVLLAPVAVSEMIKEVFSKLLFVFDAVYDISEIAELLVKYPSAIVMAFPGPLNRNVNPGGEDQNGSFFENTGITLVSLMQPDDNDNIPFRGNDSFAWLGFPPGRRELDMLIQYHQNIPAESGDHGGTAGHNESRATESQPEYRERYKRIFDSLPMVSIQGYNLDRDVVFWNKASETLYGYTIEEAVGRKLEDLIIPGELKQRMLDDISNFLKYNRPIPPAEYLLQRKDGKRVPVFTSNVIITNNAGEKELFSIDIDLSQLKRHQLIQEVLNEIAASISISGDLPDFLQSVRFHLSKIINTRNFFIAFYNEADNSFSLPIFIDDKDRFRSFPAGRTLTAYMISLNKPLLLNEEQMNELEERGEIDRIGSICRQWLGIPLKRDGRITGAIVLQSYSDDISYDDTDMRTLQIVAEQVSIAIDRKAAQEALRESERALKTLISNLPGIAYRCRFDRSWTMEFLSDGFTLLTGYPVGDCIENRKMSYSDIIHPDDREKIWVQVEDAVSLDKPYHLVFRIITASGSVRWVWEKGRAIFGEGKQVIALEGFIVDITDRIEMENQVIAAKEKAEESDRLKSAFLANLSHEIRSPMNSIMGFSQLLKSGNTSGSVSEYADIIYQSSGQLLSVISNIVDQARIDTGQVNPAKKPFRPSALMKRLEKQALELLLVYDKNDVAISACPDAGSENLVLESDEELVCRVMMHLVNNALKFTEAGSVEFGFNIAGDNSIEFFVKDTGIGIPGKYHDIIFERFRQADEGITRNFDGAGLGLSISRGIAELLQGNISVISNEGKGSEFYFALPLK